MKTKTLAKKFAAWVLCSAIFATQTFAWLDFWWWGSWSPESYIIHNSLILEWWNDKFEQYKQKYIKAIKKVAEKWWLTQLKVKLPWWGDLKYVPDTQNTGQLKVAYKDKISLTSNKNWDITIIPPTNAPFKDKFQFSYIIPWLSNQYYSLWNSNWVKTYNNMYNAMNAWKTIVFSVKDWDWDITYTTSKLWSSATDLYNISWNWILDYYEQSDNWKTSVEKWSLEVTKTLIDNNSDWNLTCTWSPNDTKCTPNLWEKITYTFTSKNTAWSNVTIPDFSLSLTWTDTSSFTTIENTCDWKTSLTAWESCKISYAVISNNSFTSNKELTATLKLNANALIQFNWNESNSVVNLPVLWEVTWFWSWSWYVISSNKMNWCTKWNRVVFLKDEHNKLEIAWCDLWDDSTTTAWNRWSKNWHYYWKQAAAKTACPTWWHLPSIAEWRLVTEVLTRNQATSSYPWNTWWEWSNSQELRKSMQELLNWDRENNAQTLPGYHNTNGNYNNQGSNARYWSSTESSSANARNLDLSSSYGLYWSNDSKEYGFSVRCFKDQ